MSPFRVSKTHDVVTPESAEVGDFAETGFDWQDREYGLRDLLRDIQVDGFVEPSCWPCDRANFVAGLVWLSTVDPDVNYRTGEYTTYSLHIEGSERNMARLFRFLAIRYPKQFRA